MLKKILLLLVALIVLFVVVVMMRPSDFRVSRSATMRASPEKVFEQVNNLHAWEAWSPWIKIDPQAKTFYQGPPAGVGASFGWSGNDELGEGRMTITESTPSDLVRFRLNFIRPFVGTNTAEFTFRPEGNQTLVTWSMFGEANFIAKVVGLFIDCDKMVGEQFEKGLTQMKSIVETPAAPKEALPN